MNVDYILSAHGIGGGRKSKDKIPPPPVIGLEAVASGDDLIITWQNPDDTDFVGVRIMKSESGYPASENDGVLLYNGALKAFTDVGVTKGTYTYYRAFTYDFDNNYQSDGSQIARGAVKADQVAPTKPVLKEVTHDVVTLEPTIGHEYSLNTTTWQTSNVFEGLEPGTTYTFYQRKAGTDLLNPSPASEGLAVTTHARDPFGAPGPQNLVAGDMTQGYFGETSTTDLISGTDLASMIGLTYGVAQHDTSPWVKSAIDGKVIYWAKKTFRSSISWDRINAAGAVDGSKLITIGDHQYRVRLFSGSTTNPSKSNGADVYGSEFNRVVLPTHEQAKNGSWSYPNEVGPNDAPNNWGINYTDADLVFISSAGNGSYSWMQEVRTGQSTYRLTHGYFGVSYASAGIYSSTNAFYGWRPVLEVVS